LNLEFLSMAVQKPILITKRLVRSPYRALYVGACSLALLVGYSAAHFTTETAPTPTAVQVAPLAEAPKPERPLVTPSLTQYRVQRGETLMSILTGRGVEETEAEAALDAMHSVYNTKTLGRGQKLAIEIDASEEDPTVPSLSSLSMPLSKTTTVKLERSQDGSFKAQKIEKPTVKALSRLKGTINGSFIRSAQNLGLSQSAIAELVKAYSYDVDFQRDLKAGDKLEVVLEQTKTTDGIVVSNGGVVYANLDLGERQIPVYRYVDAKGRADYFDAKGQSLKKALLKTPINGAQVTSGFGMRTHPILGYSKMHKGMDFGAATGTPIYAAGDGVVESAGWSGGYGNLVVLKHTAKYSTAYGHASRIASGIKEGARVRQGQVIAYVGSTGQSTGPHLHYEVRMDGGQVNPSNIKFKTGTALAGADLKKFKATVSSVDALLGKKTKTANAKPAAKKAVKKKV
jgi:murein DD-endopeptidase MepM/ murein hydrolase activator NlpD